MIISEPDYVDLQTVGCIITYDSHYLLTNRKKDSCWGSVAGKIEFDETPLQAIKREIQEELGLTLTPTFFTTTHHQYGSQKVAYSLHEYNFASNPLENIVLEKKELVEVSLFSIDEALKLPLFEDEDYCLRLHSKKNP